MDYGPEYQADRCRGMRMTVTPNVFPASWGWRRVAEIYITIYQFGVGLLFWFLPEILELPVYANVVAIMTPGQWAISLWCVCLGHMSALYLNGSAPRISAPFRLLSCAAHMGLVVQLIVGFWSIGAFWPVWSYIWLIGVPLVGAASTAFDDLYVAIRRKRAVGQWKQ